MMAGLGCTGDKSQDGDLRAVVPGGARVPTGQSMDFCEGAFFFFNGHTWGICKFPGQGLNLSCGFKLHHSCSNS